MPLVAILADSWFVLRTQGPVLLVVLAFVLAGSVVVAQSMLPLLPAASGKYLIFPLALAGWGAPVFLFALLLFASALLLHLNPAIPAAALLAILVIASCIWAMRNRERLRLGVWPAFLPLLVLFGGFLFLRLGFIAGTPLPLYFDSAEHYRIIRNLLYDYLHLPAIAALEAPVQSYYHLGYHLMLALMAAVSRANLSQLMLVCGVVALAALPFPLYVIPFQETGSRLAGWFAVFLGAVGWYVPAYVLNWGKYPALFGFPLVLFTLDLAYLAHLAPRGGRVKRALSIWVLFAACVALLVHTRSVILIGIALTSWQISGAWATRPSLQRGLLVALTLALLVGVLGLLARTGLLAIVLDPYVESGLGVSCMVALLAVGAFWVFPRLALTAMLTVLFMCLSLMVRVPGFAATPLLDRPLVEMTLFAPLSILAAIGIAAVTRLLKSAHPFMRVGIVVACLGVILQAAVGYSYSPSSCCNFVTADDTTALDWIQNHVGTTDRILIAMAPARDAPPPYPPLVASSDAGVWILPLTGRQTTALPYWSDFASAATHSTLSVLGVQYIYVGGTPRSFNAGSLDQRPDWYQLELALPASRVYAVSGYFP
jgi:hypothetical protein